MSAAHPLTAARGPGAHAESAELPARALRGTGPRVYPGLRRPGILGESA